MKRFFLVILTLLMVLAVCTAGYVFAAPDTSPDPESTAQPDEDDTQENDEPAGDGFQIITLSSSGDDVLRSQYRLYDLGYFNYRPTGHYGQMSRQSAITFQVANSLMSDGSIGQETYSKLFENPVVRAPMATGLNPTSGPALEGDPQQTGRLVTWEEADNIMHVGSTYIITDFNSGTRFTVKRSGGVHHAVVEPVNSEDTDAFLEAFGGAFNYEKRSVLVEINAQQYAASLFGWPLGEDTVSDNAMQGGLALYFSGSTSDVFAFPDVEHEDMIKRAAS